MVPASERLGIGQVVFSPLAQGLLTGRLCARARCPDSRAARPDGNGQQVQRMLTDVNLERIDKLRPIATELGMTLSQVAIACLRLPNISSVIVGASKPSHVEDNVAASGKTIPAEVLQKIDEIFDGGRRR